MAAAKRYDPHQPPGSCVFRAKTRILSQNHRRKTLDRKTHLTNSFQLSPLSRATEVDKPCVVLRRLISPKRYNLHRTPGSSGSCVFRAKKRILSQNCPRNTLYRKMHLTKFHSIGPPKSRLEVVNLSFCCGGYLRQKKRQHHLS